MINIRFPLIALAISAVRLPAQGVEALWYSTPSEHSTKDFLDHADQISIVAPQVFMFVRDGGIRGKVDQRVIDKAKENGVKLIPLVMNPNFDQALMHHILTNPATRLTASRSITALRPDRKCAG